MGEMGGNDKIWGKNVRKVGKICENDWKEIPMEMRY
jgi:hypothetical protein